MTITMRTVYDTITTALSGINGLDDSVIFHGAVPDTVPTYPTGRIRPYVAVWPRVPVPTDDMALSGVQVRDGLAFPFQTTCVATDLYGELMPLTDYVADALTGLQIGTQSIRHESSIQSSQFLGGGEYLQDPDLPERYFVPLRWYLETQ